MRNRRISLISYVSVFEMQCFKASICKLKLKGDWPYFLCLDYEVLGTDRDRNLVVFTFLRIIAVEQF